jgi:serine/threonine protein kinase
VRSLLQPAGSPDVLGRLENYDVTEVLGQGSMGLVLKAFDPALKRWVAIKVLSPDLAGDRVARQRFAREAQAAAALRHPHVVTIHAVREVEGLPFLVMEYVTGGSLQDYLDHHGPPDWRVIAQLGADIASGLAAAHAHGLVHRDIKPSNILLQTDSTAETAETRRGAAEAPSLRLSAPSAVRSFVPKIADFGLVRVADESRLTQTGIITGTPMYMSPEQALCAPVDERADLFSLGSVLYALCTGLDPFPAGSPMAVLRQVCEATPRPIRELNPAIPAWLAALVERLQAKHPADRFASAAEVAELLRYNLDHPDEPRLVPPPHTAARVRWTRSRLTVAVLLAVLLLGTGLLLSESHRWTHRQGRVPLRAMLEGHNGPVWSVAFAPDGRTLATGSDDATLRFWDAATGKAEAVRPGHGSAVLWVAYAHSGQFLVTGGGDGLVRLWDAATRSEKAVLPHQGGTGRRAPTSPDDRTIAVASSTQGVELWDVPSRTLRLTLPGHQGSIRALAFAPDGRTLATGGTSGRIRLWDPATGAERANFLGDALGLRALAFAPDSQTLASAGTGDKDVKLWKVATHEEVAALSGGENGVLQSVAYSPAGRLLATGGIDGTVRVWDVTALQPVATLHAHDGTVWSVAFSPDGRTLATAGEDRVARLWDLSGLTGPAP